MDDHHAAGIPVYDPRKGAPGDPSSWGNASLSDLAFDEKVPVVDLIVALSNGNAGAAHALGAATSHLKMTGSLYPTPHIFLRWLHEMNIVGPQVWIAFKGYSGMDIPVFIQNIRNNSAHLIDFLNKAPGRDPAVAARRRRSAEIHGTPSREIHVHYRDTNHGAPDTLHFTVSVTAADFRAGGVAAIDALLTQGREWILEHLEQERRG